MAERRNKKNKSCVYGRHGVMVALKIVALAV